MPKISKDTSTIDNLLERAVEKIYPSKHDLKKRLGQGKLRVKLGIDPTGDKIHIGRAVVFRKLREFQKLGHTIVLIIGDYTAQIGDPSDKLEKRPFLTAAQVKTNMNSYLSQIGKIFDVKKAEVHHNSTWLKKFNLHEVSHLAEQFSVQQMMQRRNFKERLKCDQDISLSELLYPMMQGYDSVAVKADIELGGTDQLFNLMAGRKVQQRYGQKPQLIMTTKMLLGLDGRKMSTSWGNVINIIDKPEDMFGKVMSMHDETIISYMELATDMSLAEIKDRAKHMKSGTLNPRDAKAELARNIVTLYHDKKKAVDAEKVFIKTFAKKETPIDIPTMNAPKGFIDIADVLLKAQFVTSKSEARRTIEQGGVKINRQKFTNWKKEITLNTGDIIQVGKRKFVRIK